MYEKRGDQQKWLESLIRKLEGVAGTVRVRRHRDLYLAAAHNIPPQVVAAVARVPAICQPVAGNCCRHGAGSS
jgi:hypothetical protein